MSFSLVITTHMMLIKALSVQQWLHVKRFSIRKMVTIPASIWLGYPRQKRAFFRYFWIRNDIAFAVDTLKTSLLAIKGSPGPFIASACVFMLQGVWLLIFAGAYYELNGRIGEFILIIAEFSLNLFVCVVP